MKKLIALCLACVMSLAVLAGCTSADPEHPFDRDPAPKIETSAAEE